MSEDLNIKEIWDNIKIDNPEIDIDERTGRPKGCYTMEEIAQYEMEFIKEYISYEEEMKELKQRFKALKSEYQGRGVNTKIAIKTVKKIAKKYKLSDNDITDEERMENSIRNDVNLFTYLTNVLV